MENETVQGQDPTEQKANRARKLAGKALAVFVALMIALTWASRILEAMTIATVATTNTQRGALEKQVRQSGTLEAAETVPVLTTETARVLDIYVKTGADVAEGDALFRLDYTDAVKAAHDQLIAARQTADKKRQTLDWAAADLGLSTINRILQRMDSVTALEAALRAAEAAYESDASAENRARLSQAKSAFDTEKRLLDSDTHARDYRTKRDEANEAAEDLEAAEEDFLELMRELDGLPELSDVQAAAEEYSAGREYMKTFKAPVSGSVLESSLSKGSMASPNSPAMTLSNEQSGLSLTVSVDEDSAADMAIGDVARIVIAGERYDSAIVSIATSKDRQSMLDISFKLGEGVGAPGMSAEMVFTKRTQNYDIIIPLSALRHDSDGDFVYTIVQQEGALGARLSVSRVDVYVLDQDSGRVALQSGLSQRDMVVERSDRSLADGDRVRLEE